MKIINLTTALFTLALNPPINAAESVPVSFGEHYEFFLSGIQKDIHRYNIAIVTDNKTKRTVALETQGDANNPYVIAGGDYLFYYNTTKRRIDVYEIDDDFMDKLTKKKPDDFINEIRWFRQKRVDGLYIYHMEWTNDKLKLVMEERPGPSNPVIVWFDPSNCQLTANKDPGGFFETIRGGTIPKVVETKEDDSSEQPKK